MSASRPLYGGAITASVPANYVDARWVRLSSSPRCIRKELTRPAHSDLRQVPDTQEVFLAPDSDLSYIVEVLELVKDEQSEHDLDKAVR